MGDMRILVVWGLGGAGKSQLVLNYIREYRQDYTAVFWIEAGSKESIERDYVQIYRLLYSRQIDEGHEIVKVEDAVPAVKRWFQGREGRWLVVLDSADTIDNDRDRRYIDLSYFMPDAPGLHVVITSRSSTVKEMTALDAVEVAEMESSEATELFKRSAKMTQVGSASSREIERIVEELGHLALAISLAGSYVSATPRLRSNIKKYLPEYRERRKALLQRQPKQHVHHYGESVLSTWEASFEAIENHNPAAARLLGLLAFINFEDIFLGLFNGDSAGALVSAPTSAVEPSEASTSSVETWWMFLFGERRWTAYDLESAFETLQEYSMIQWKSDQESYAMHKLVHAWGQDRLEEDRQRQLSSLALELMADITAKDQIDPDHQLRLVPHLMACFGIFAPLQESLDEFSTDQLSMIKGIVKFLYESGRWSEAYNLQAFLLGKVEKMLGKEHPSTLISMDNLAVILDKQGKYKEAEEMHQRVLLLRERVLGKEHPHTLSSMNNLASAMDDQGRYEEAEEIHRRVLLLRERVLGKEHPDTLSSMNNLATVLYHQCKYEEAEEMHQRVLPLRERVLGKEHPNTLTSVSNLADTLNSQSRYKEAEELSRRALAIRGRVLGKDHPHTLTSVYNLACLLHRKKQYKDAEVLYRQAWTGFKQTLGEEHPFTAGCLLRYTSMLNEEKGG